MDKDKLLKLIQDPVAFKAFIEKLPPEEQDFFLKFAVDLGNYVELNPLNKFKKNNVQQQEFLEFTSPFQYFIGGNKGGKTATITYKGILVALGLHPGFKRKPEVGNPLINWLCGENRAVIEETPLQELRKWLRPDQWKLIKKGMTVDRIRIYPDPNERDLYSDFILKPYEGGVDIFESANINGVILADEEIPEDIFRAMIPRMVAHGAWLLNALTPTHGLTYTKDVLEGKGQYAGFQADKLVDWVEVTTQANIENIDRKMYFTMIRAYGVHNDKGQLLDVFNRPIENLDDILLPGGPEPKLSAEGEVRLKGKFTSLTGKVYPNFKRRVGGKGWHVFDIEELPNLDECRFFAFSDYGRRDPFVFCLVAVDRDNTHWVLEEEYTTDLETYDQALAIRRICDNWEVRPLMVVADCQIKDRKATGGKIIDDYLNARYKLSGEEEGVNGTGPLILGPNFTTWRAKYEDKMSPATARADIGRMLDVNPKTGKPSIRFNEALCSKTIRCIENLQWKRTGTSEDTAGTDDHGEAGLRYYTRAKISYENWESADDFEEQQNTVTRYRSRVRWGGNYRSV